MQAIAGDLFCQRRFAAMEEKEKDSANDPIMVATRYTNFCPTRILEIGCSFGWRINKLYEKFGGECHGIEPSKMAVEIGKERYPNVTFSEGVAESLPYGDGYFDLVVFGHCLCYCDRGKLFAAAYHADRVLKTGGYLIVHDFYPSVPHYNRNVDWPTINTYKMDYSTMFSWHPAYRITYRNIMVEPGNVAGDKVATVTFNKIKVE